MKSINNILIIREKDSPTFVRNFNENKVDKNFLETCRKAGKLFGKEEHDDFKNK